MMLLRLVLFPFVLAKNLLEIVASIVFIIVLALIKFFISFGENFVKLMNFLNKIFGKAN